MPPEESVVDRSQGGDPSVVRAVRRDLLGLPPGASSPGVVDRLLGMQRPDGQWGVGTYDSDDWDSTMDALWLLHELDADPDEERVQDAIERVAEQVRWEERHGGRPFFEGEVEACVNGRVLTLCARFGRASDALAARLLEEQLPDGGWNCDAPASGRSSFHSTVCVLEGLVAVSRAASGPAVEDALRRGTAYLLDRGMLRSASAGRLIDEEWLAVHVPAYWCYDVLRGLDLLRSAGVAPDERTAEALRVLRAARRADGRWSARTYPGRPVVELPPGDADSWATLRALRVLEWADGAVSGSTDGSRTTTRRP